MADILASCFASLIASGIGSVCSCVSAGGSKSLRNLTANLRALDRELAELIALSEDVKRTVYYEAEENPNMRQKEVVKLWFDNIERVESEVADQLKYRDQEVDKLCVSGFCSKSLKLSYRFKRKVENLLQEVTDLKRQGDAFQDVTVEVRPPAHEELIDQRIIVGQQSMLDKVWKLIGQENCGTIGLYGMPGVGKTTLLKQINNRFCEEPLGYQVVIMVVVSNAPNFVNIREEIAKRLGLSHDESWTNKSDEGKMKDICNALCKKKFVLLLDDIWHRIQLTELGVPLQCLKSGSKIVFTSRKYDVCCKMEADENVEVKCLSVEQASKLFRHKVGNITLDSHPRIRKLADEVVKECDCLPLALITVGEVMAGKDQPSEWEDAIEVLRTSAAEFEDMEEKVFSCLKFSYDNLSSDTVRSCLLYCRLYPEDYEISTRDLIDCWVGEGFLSRYNDGYVIISNLVQACLLEKVDQDKVKMHDLIRDMTLWIACGSEKEKENCLVEAPVRITKATEIAKWEGVKRMSTMNSKIDKLPIVDTHLDIQTLFLKSNRFFWFPSYMFLLTPFLKVLDLSNTCLESVPSEISKLVLLQHLDLSSTKIRKLPIELTALVNLRCLKLEYAESLCIVPHELICGFKQLQVFRLIGCFSVGSTSTFVGSTSNFSILSGGNELLVEELCCLTCLKALSFELRSFEALHVLLSSRILKSCTQILHLRYFRPWTFDVLLLKDMKNLNDLYMYRCRFQEMKIECAHKFNIKTHGFHSIHTIHIVNCKNLRDLTWLIFVPNLKAIQIEFCSSMEEIFSYEKLSEVQKTMGIIKPFAKLQWLHLGWLSSLKIICQNALPFPHLKHLIVRHCPDLKELPFDSNSAKDSQIVIEGEQDWWKKLQWKDEHIKNAFLPCFKSL